MEFQDNQETTGEDHTGCHGNDYCPYAPVTRAQMATFLDRAFGLGQNVPIMPGQSPQPSFPVSGPTGPESGSVTFSMRDGADGWSGSIR